MTAQDPRSRPALKLNFAKRKPHFVAPAYALLRSFCDRARCQRSCSEPPGATPGARTLGLRSARGASATMAAAVQKQPPAAQRSPAAIAALADRLLTDVLPLGPSSRRAFQILRDCAGDLEKAAPMLCAPAAGAVDKDAGATGARRGADAGAAMPPAAPGNKRPARGDASTVDADGAPATTAKKAKPAARPVTPDAGPAAVAGPGAPAEASASVVSPEASGELPAPRVEATPSVQLAPPPVEPLRALGDAAASTDTKLLRARRRPNRRRRASPTRRAPAH